MNVVSRSIIVHSSNDKVVPFGDSIQLCPNNPGLSIIPAGQDHRLNDQQAPTKLYVQVKAAE